MFATGHMALGYIIGKALSKATKENLDIPTIMIFSLLPDIDLVIPGLPHRGPTHSLIIAVILFIPLFIIYKPKRTIPYFAALTTHSLIGDYITTEFACGGVMLLWPISSKWIGYRGPITVGKELEAYIELALFAALLATMFISRDYKQLFNSDIKNTLLIIPLFAVVVSALYEYPLRIPVLLTIPHIILFGVFTLSLVKTVIPLLTDLRILKK